MSKILTAVGYLFAGVVFAIGGFVVAATRGGDMDFILKWLFLLGLTVLSWPIWIHWYEIITLYWRPS